MKLTKSVSCIYQSGKELLWFKAGVKGVVITLGTCWGFKPKHNALVSLPETNSSSLSSPYPSLYFPLALFDQKALIGAGRGEPKAVLNPKQ